MANTNYSMYQAALALFTAAPQATVTPAQLVATMGPVGMAMAPASKQAWKLGTLGFDITANKDGRNVVSYTMVSAAANAPAQKAVAAAKPKAPKVAKVKAPKVVAPKVVAKAASAKSPTAKKTAKVAAPIVTVTDADIAAAAASVDIGDINELDDRSDLPDFLR
jgi:hypothetical protein